MSGFGYLLLTLVAAAVAWFWRRGAFSGRFDPGGGWAGRTWRRLRGLVWPHADLVSDVVFAIWRVTTVVGQTYTVPTVVYLQLPARSRDGVRLNLPTYEREILRTLNAEGEADAARRGATWPGVSSLDLHVTPKPGPQAILVSFVRMVLPDDSDLAATPRPDDPAQPPAPPEDGPTPDAPAPRSQPLDGATVPLGELPADELLAPTWDLPATIREDLPETIREDLPATIRLVEPWADPSSFDWLLTPPGAPEAAVRPAMRAADRPESAIRVGRRGDADVRLPHAPALSADHARLRLTERGLEVTDTSRYGTWYLANDGAWHPLTRDEPLLLGWHAHLAFNAEHTARLRVARRPDATR